MTSTLFAAKLDRFGVISLKAVILGQNLIGAHTSQRVESLDSVHSDWNAPTLGRGR